MARRVKTDYNSKGYKHREHRSKKGRKQVEGHTSQIKDWKRTLEKLHLDDLDEELSNLT